MYMFILLLDICGNQPSPPMYLTAGECGNHAPIRAPSNICLNHNGEESCLPSGNCSNFPQESSYSESDHNYCDCKSTGNSQNLVIHKLKFALTSNVYERKFNSSMVKVQNYFKNEVIEKMTYAMMKSINSENKVNLEFDIPCCVKFEFDDNNVLILEGKDLIADDNGEMLDSIFNYIESTYQEFCSEIFQRENDFSDFNWDGVVSTTRKSKQIECLASALGITFTIIDRDDNRLPIAGASFVAVGSGIIASDSKFDTYLHELGHLFGMAHYPDDSDWGYRLMATGDSSDRRGEYKATSVTCRDCNRFSLKFNNHTTISSKLTDETCISFDDFDGGLSNIKLAGSTRIPTETNSGWCSFSLNKYPNNHYWVLVFIFTILLKKRHKK